MGFHQNLKYLMKEHGYTSNYQLAPAIGVSQAAIGAWFNDGRTPYKRTLDKIGDLFNVTVEELCADELPPIRKQAPNTTIVPEYNLTNDQLKFALWGDSDDVYDMDDDDVEDVRIYANYLRERKRQLKRQNI